MIVKSESELKKIAWELGKTMNSRECIELRGDIGVGKTTFVQGLAEGLGVSEKVNSPTYTIEKSYLGRDDLTLNHYDFYRLEDAGVMRREIEESLMDEKNITVVEWADTVQDVLPAERTIVEIKYVPDHHGWREVEYVSGY